MILYLRTKEASGASGSLALGRSHLHEMKREREPPHAAARTPNVLMLGTGEYTTGFVGTGAADSDKGTGVVALVMLDLQRRGKVGRLGMCGTNGRKLPQIRAHMQRVLGDVYTGIDPSRVETWPADDVVDPKAYLAACAAFEPGDVAIIFTPDDTHFEIAEACLSRGAHHALPPPHPACAHRPTGATAEREVRPRGPALRLGDEHVCTPAPTSCVQVCTCWSRSLPSRRSGSTTS